MSTNRASKNITERERTQIETLVRANRTAKEIAAQLHRGVSTIYRELQRGKCECMDYEWRFHKAYGADKAAADAHQKARNRSHDLKLGKDYKLAEYIEMQMDGKTSPAVIARRIQKQSFSCTVSKNTIYDWIRKGYLNTDESKLPQGKTKRKPKAPRNKPQAKNILKPSIEHRPSEIALRDAVGHWEMDTVVGTQKGKSTCLLVLTERKTRFELVYRLNTKSARCVVDTIGRLRKHLKQDFTKIFKTITVDNGTEFSDNKGIEQNKVNLYYCHSYSSWERGSNENQNKLVRRHIPKGKSMKNVTQKQAKQIQDWMNDYERAILGWQTPREVFLADLSKHGIDTTYFA